MLKNPLNFLLLNQPSSWTKSSSKSQIRFRSSFYSIYLLFDLTIKSKSKQYITSKTHKSVLGKQANFLQVFKKCLFCLGNFAHKVAKMQTTTLCTKQKKSCTALLNFFTTMTIMCSRFCKLVKLEAGKKNYWVRNGLWTFCCFTTCKW